VYFTTIVSRVSQILQETKKKPFTKVKAHISTINFISASAENFGETACDIYFT